MPKTLAEAYDVLLFDLDGVVYIGGAAIPGAPEALQRARRAGDHAAAAEYLALAAAMRPDRKPYTDALRQVRATLKSREQAP